MTQNTIIGLYDLVNLKEPYQIPQKVSLKEIFSQIKNGTYASQCQYVRQAAAIYDKMIGGLSFDELKELEQTKEYKMAKKALSDAKLALKCFTVSGLFKNNERNGNGLIPNSFTQIMQVDIDWKDNQLVYMKELRENLVSLPYVVSVFTSPSGNGLKVFVKHNAPQSKNLEAFIFIEKLFADNFDVVIDKQCKDISRVCFVSYDKNIFVNDNVTSLEIDYEVVNTLIAKEKETSNNVRINTANNSTDVFSHCVWLVEKKISFVAGSKSNFRYNLACLLNEFGISKDETESFIKANYPNSTKEKAIDVESVYKHRKHRHGIKTYIPKNEYAKLSQDIKNISKLAVRNGRNIDSVIEIVKTTHKGLSDSLIVDIAASVFNAPNLDTDLQALKDAIFGGELGLAEYIAETYKDIFIFDKTAKEWRFYKKGVWNICHSFEFENTVFARIIDDFYLVKDSVTEESELKIFAKFSHSIRTRKFQTNVTALAAQKMSIRKDDLDTYENLLCLDNYVLDFSNKQIKAINHNPKFYLTNTNGIEFNENAKCPIFDKFINETMIGDVEMVRFIQKVFGLCLTGFTIKNIFFFYGAGGDNGKSILLNSLSYLLGDFYVKVSESKFEKSYFEDSKKKFAGLEGKRAVISGEMNEEAILDDSALKSFTGNELVPAEHKYEKPFNYVPQGKIIMFGNYAPVVKGKDEAFYNRFILVPFLNKVPKDKQDLELDTKIKSEIAGVLNWALRGLQAYFVEGLTIPKRIQEATNDYKNNQINDLSQDAMLILERIRPATYKDEKGNINEGVQLLTATEIISMFADIRNNMSRDFLGREMKRLGFVSKSYGKHIKGNSKVYCVQIVNE